MVGGQRHASAAHAAQLGKRQGMVAAFHCPPRVANCRPLAMLVEVTVPG